LTASELAAAGEADATLGVVVFIALALAGCLASAYVNRRRRGAHHDDRERRKLRSLR